MRTYSLSAIDVAAQRHHVLDVMACHDHSLLPHCSAKGQYGPLTVAPFVRSLDKDDEGTEDMHGPHTEGMHGPHTEGMHGPHTEDMHGPHPEDMHGPHTEDMQSHATSVTDRRGDGLRHGHPPRQDINSVVWMLTAVVGVVVRDVTAL